jgi:hypothetical protein
MTVADEARQNAIPLEVKKDGLQQRQNGDWVLRLVVQAADMDPRLTNAAMGTRFMAALVEVGDDEQPKTTKKDWREMTPASQAAIRCGDKNFRDFLRSEHGLNTKDKDEAAEAIRGMCGVKSRMDLATNHKARTLWHQIDTQYREWAHL